MYFIQNCSSFSSADRISLRESYKAKKKTSIVVPSTQPSGNINLMKNKVTNRSQSDSALFGASFPERSLTFKPMPDQGADSNLMPYKLLDMTGSRALTTRGATIGPPLIYTGIEGSKAVHYSKELAMDIHLEVRHVSSMLLREYYVENSKRSKFIVWFCVDPKYNP